MDTAVTDAPGASRYEITVGGRLAGFAEYRDIDGARVFTHTEVFDEYEGHGIGTALVQGALDDVRASGRRLVALCPFVHHHIETHPGDYDDLVDAELTARFRSRR